MSQPPGFEDSNHPHLVCKLHKSLYGLKQAPRAWNDRFTQFLSSVGFETTYSGSSLFVKHVGPAIVVKDLGFLYYFLRIQITRTTTGLFLSQTKYVEDLLTKSEMDIAKPCDTPCLPYHRLLKEDGEPYSNPTLFRSIVRALQYLTFTRPDIAFSVHQVC